MPRPRRRRREQQQRQPRGRGWRRPQGLRLRQPGRSGGILGGPAPPRVARRLAHGAPAAGAAVRGRGAWLRPTLRPQVHLQVRLPGLGLHGRSSASPAARGQLGTPGIRGRVSPVGKSDLTLSVAIGLTPCGPQSPAVPGPHGELSGCCALPVLYRGCVAVFLSCFSPVGISRGAQAILWFFVSSISLNACSVVICKPFRSLSRFWGSTDASDVKSVRTLYSVLVNAEDKNLCSLGYFH